jgi:hypothetical protein
MLKCVNDDVTTTKPGHQRDGKAHMIWLQAAPYIWKSLRLENTQSENPGFNIGRFCDGLGSNIVVFHWSQYYPSWPNYYNGVYG